MAVSCLINKKLLLSQRSGFEIDSEK